MSADEQKEKPAPAADDTNVLSKEAKSAIRRFVHKISHEGIHNLRMQYNEIKGFVPADTQHKGSIDNGKKCRYKDIICLDRTRVVLTWPPGCADGDFIHANWVTHELLNNKFICTQAPLEATVGDFWRLVWQERVRQIVMLCRCVEMEKVKSEQYWPLNVDDKKVMTYGLTIKCIKVDRSNPNFIHTRLCLIYETDKRYIDHRQWTTWPDKSVPKTPLAPFRLLKLTRRHADYPSLIHCSAGVGRTGTLVAIELIYKALVAGIVPDPPKLLRSLRSQRFLAVQTEDQYVYCHYAIIQMAYVKGIVCKHDAKVFCKEYGNYLKMVTENGGKAPPINATKPPLDCAVCRVTPFKDEDPDDGKKEQGGGSNSASDKDKKPDESNTKRKAKTSLKEKRRAGDSRRKSKKTPEKGKADEKKTPDVTPAASPAVDDANGESAATESMGTNTTTSPTAETADGKDKDKAKKAQSMPNIALDLDHKVPKPSIAPLKAPEPVKKSAQVKPPQPKPPSTSPILAVGVPNAEVRSQFMEPVLQEDEKPEPAHDKPAEKPSAHENAKVDKKGYTVVSNGGTKRIVYHRNPNFVKAQAASNVPKPQSK